MKIETNLLLHSVGKESGVHLLTWEILHPRFILAEINTHRVFTRNGASSRAIPFKRMVEAIRANMAAPLQWLVNAPGMVTTEVMAPDIAGECDAIWNDAFEDALFHANRLNERGASKQYVNRLLEPFMMQRTLISSTRWENFYKLRDEAAAQPEFREIAARMNAIDADSDAVERSCHDSNGWHLPYITAEDWTAARAYHHDDDLTHKVYSPVLPIGESYNTTTNLLVMSAARAARTSYKTFDGETPPIENDYRTFGKLATDPLHASPMEHQAFPLDNARHDPAVTGNFHGWAQLRHMMPNESADEVVNTPALFGHNSRNAA